MNRYKFQQLSPNSRHRDGSPIVERDVLQSNSLEILLRKINKNKNVGHGRQRIFDQQTRKSISDPGMVAFYFCEGINDIAEVEEMFH